MIDIHCHVLPGIDDGCRDIPTSLEVLEKSWAQGIRHIIATPHFYASRDRIDNFIQRRNAASTDLHGGSIEEFKVPRLFFGAEVAFFNGISRAEGIEKLTVEGTNIFLLEMPTEDWQDTYTQEIRYLCQHRGMHVIIAHMERYMTRRNKRYIQEIIDMSRTMPVRVQINAGSVLDRRQARHIIKMFQKGEAHFLASDCHGLHRRPPNLAEGRAVLAQKLGPQFMKTMDDAGTAFLTNAGLELK